jgi:aminoglycoside phosphotransferase family enzyme
VHHRTEPKGRQPTIKEKVEFLSDHGAYPHPVAEVVRRETHMSWVFLAGDRAYKLKKPVRFPYLDFSTLARREAACRAELRLNRRLAEGLYLGVVPLMAGAGGLALTGPGVPVDWLVVMRRVDEARMLDRVVAAGRIETRQLDRIAATLVRFYRRAPHVIMRPADHLAAWRRSASYNRTVLFCSRFALPAHLVWRVDRAQCRFLAHRADLLAARVRAHKIVDGHGDLRPEHIWLGDSVKIIDCLEFNPSLRAVDPFDEVAYLGLELTRLGAGWAGEYLRRRLEVQLGEALPEELFVFYRCHRATLRARLAIAHLLEPHPRNPAVWPRLARTYLGLAAADAARLEWLLRRRGGRRTRALRRGGGSPQR